MRVVQKEAGHDQVCEGKYPLARVLCLASVQLRTSATRAPPGPWAWRSSPGGGRGARQQHRLTSRRERQALVPIAGPAELGHVPQLARWFPPPRPVPGAEASAALHSTADCPMLGRRPWKRRSRYRRTQLW